MPIRLGQAMRRVFRAMNDPVNCKSLFLTGLCLGGWAFTKIGLPIASREVVLDLKSVRLCVDIGRVEIISFWEIWHERCYDAIALERPQYVVDVGANIGVFSLYQAIQKHAEHVIAFEPSPGVFTRLTKNLEINGLKNVRSVNAAVGDKMGTLSFAEDRLSVNDRVSETGPLKVPCVRLDDELRDVKRVDILKIDTEGYEIHVLRGASETLKKTDRIALELHYPGEQQEIEMILSPIGFVLAWAVGNLVFYHKTIPSQKVDSASSKCV